MQRREFHRLCGGLLAGAANLSSTASANTQAFPRSALIYDNNSPVTTDSLAEGSSFIFSYPFVTTPCFIVRLNTAAKKNGSWQGGVGTDQSVVAFSAICSHKMSHPAKPISHINFRADKLTYYDSDGIKQERGQLISCCSERSVYDPANGGAVLSGPAPVPLASISLEVGDNGQIFAVGSTGVDQYERFLEKFGFRLAMEYGVTDIRARAGEQTIATLAEEFSTQQIRC